MAFSETQRAESGRVTYWRKMAGAWEKQASRRLFDLEEAREELKDAQKLIRALREQLRERPVIRRRDI